MLLVKDGGIRWSSTYAILLRAYKLRKAFELYQLRDKPSKNDRNIPYSDIEDRTTPRDWDEVKGYIKLLHSFVTAMQHLQGNSEEAGHEGARGSLWEVFVWLQMFDEGLAKASSSMVDEDDSHFKTAVLFGQGKLEQYWDMLMSETSFYYASPIDDLSNIDEHHEFGANEDHDDASPSQTVKETPEPEAQVIHDLEDTATVRGFDERDPAPGAGNADQHRTLDETSAKSILEQIEELTRAAEGMTQAAILKEARARQLVAENRLKLAEDAIAAASQDIPTKDAHTLLNTLVTTPPVDLLLVGQAPHPTLPKIAKYYGRTIRQEVLFIRECELHQSHTILLPQ